MDGADGSTAHRQADGSPDIHVLLFGDNTAGPEQIRSIKVAAAALSHLHTLLLCQQHHATATILKSCMHRSFGSCAMPRFVVYIASLHCRCQALASHSHVAERHLVAPRIQVCVPSWHFTQPCDKSGRTRSGLQTISQCKAEQKLVHAGANRHLATAA